MQKKIYVFALVLPIVALIGAIAFGVHQFTTARAATSVVVCVPTGYMKDGINLTAAVIATPAMPNVNGTVNATGCNIGVYYAPGIKGTVKAEVFGANYYGIVNNGSKVTVSHSYVHNIGEVPFNGTQHGVGIYFAYDNASTGKITDTTVSQYQKGGIVVNGSSSSATIDENTVTGLGPVNFIAQNGIQVGFGAKGTVTNNTVTGNSYTGPGVASSGGILVVGGACYGSDLTTGVKIKDNSLKGNDVGVFLSNLGLDTNGNCVLPTSPTHIVTSNNKISNDAVNNTSGGNLEGQPGAYQAGVSDQGYGDSITSNKICGVGYTPVPNPPPFLSMIDVAATNPIISNNKSCSTNKNISSTSHLASTFSHRHYTK